MIAPDIAGLCEELRESANAICDDPPFHDREGDPVPPVVDPDKLFDAADTLERQAAEIERLNATCYLDSFMASERKVERQAAEIERLRGALRGLLEIDDDDVVMDTPGVKRRLAEARAALTGEDT
jgi:hypothetical protein